MGKLLRVLVIVLLLAAVGALVMEHFLFGKREVLRGRVVTMQRGIERFARTIESAPAEAPAVRPNLPERDISPTTAEPEPSPRQSQFWSNYQIELESLDQPVMDLTPRRRELLSLFRLDPVTGKPIIDRTTGTPVMDGEGTMQGVIDDVLTRAGQQYNTLTATRQQLRLLREEFVTVIQEFNELKGALRQEKARVAQLEREKADLEAQLAAARRELQQEQDRVRELERRIADMEQEMLVLREERDTLKLRNEEQLELIATLQRRVSDLEQMLVRQGPGGGPPTGEAFGGGLRIDISVGEKGRVVSVDHKYLFAVIELDPAFTEELVAASVEGRLPILELFVERGDGDEQERSFIAKVRLTQLKQDRNLAIGDIMLDWMQTELREGDRVFYQ